MRRIVMSCLAPLLCQVAVAPPPTVSYRVEIVDATHTTDSEGSRVDTLMGTAIVRLTLRDTAGGAIATFIVDSANSRHTNGQGSSPLLAVDSGTVGTVARFLVVPGHRALLLATQAGDSATRTVELDRFLVPHLWQFFELVFPTWRARLGTGDHWTDTTRDSWGTVVKEWRIGEKKSGILAATVRSSTMMARGAEGLLMRAWSTSVSELNAPAAGPLVQATIRSEGTTSLDVEGRASERMGINSSTVIRITRRE